MNLHTSNKKGMTMIEILIVLVIISMLFATFFYIWNAMDIFRKSRDSKRINDLYALDTALKTILATEGNINLGQENVIYTSLPDSSSTCGSYNLVPVFSPFSYRCQTVTNYLKVDGNGWVPVNFTLGKILTIAVLPADPLNNKDYFYSYQVKQGRYKLTARFESKNNIPKMADDGGFEPTLHEVGSNLFIPSPHSGLVGYWSFDEGTGIIAYDKSGYGNNGTLLDASSTNADGSRPPQWTTGKVGGALSFDGVDDYVSVANSASINTSRTSIIAWVKFNDITNVHSLIQHMDGCVTNGYFVTINRITSCTSASADKKIWIVSGSNSVNSGDMASNSMVNTTNWNLIGFTWDSTIGGSIQNIYLNAQKDKERNLSIGTPSSRSSNLLIGRITNCWCAWSFSGLIDEVRIYNRALSDQEIKALYEATR
jgi:prepilin-type N-terminal cleavage/methylation domain-containing protein